MPTRRKYGAVVRFTDDGHVSEATIENYAMGRLTGQELVDFEEHYLWCVDCQDRLAHEDSVRIAVRESGAARPAPQSVSAPQWTLRQLAYGLGLLAVIGIVCAGIGWRSVKRSSQPPIAILLHTTRGAEEPAAVSPAARQAIILTLDLNGLPRFAQYTLEIVDAVGRPVAQAALSSNPDGLRITLPRGLITGSYFVRLYAPTKELLREYALTVHA